MHQKKLNLLGSLVILFDYVVRIIVSLKRVKMFAYCIVICFWTFLIMGFHFLLDCFESDFRLLCKLFSNKNILCAD